MSKFPHGGDAFGAQPSHPLLAPVLRPALELSRQQALLDLAAIQRISGLVGYWPADPAYLFEDSAGTTPASVNGVVGCARNLLSAPVYTPVTITNSDFELGDDGSWTKGTNWTIGSGVATKTAGTASVLAHSVSLTPGTTYLLTVTTSVSAGWITPRLTGGTTNNGALISTSGTIERTFVALTGNNVLDFYATDIFAGTVDNVTLVAVANAPALQATTAVKPYWRKTPTSNVYWLDSNTSTSALNATLSNTALGRRNLLTYSEDFSNAAWTKTNITVTPNAAVAPDGTLTAELVVPTVASNTHVFYPATLTSSAGNVFSLSVYAKANGYDFISLSIHDGAVTAGHEVIQNFNLSTCTVASYFNTAPTSASIVSVGGGWCRCSITWTVATTSSNFTIFIGETDASPRVSWAGNGTSGVYIWGAQGELGASATDYQKVTSAPAYCTVARATAEGVTFSDNAEITNPYNIAPPFGFNTDIAIFNRALTETEKALVTRYMARCVPVLGSELMTNGQCNSIVGWSGPTSDGSLSSTGGELTVTAATTVVNPSDRSTQQAVANGAGGIFAKIRFKRGTTVSVNLSVSETSFSTDVGPGNSTTTFVETSMATVRSGATCYVAIRNGAQSAGTSITDYISAKQIL